jgi:hypothetical protein
MSNTERIKMLNALPRQPEFLLRPGLRRASFKRKARELRVPFDRLPSHNNLLGFSSVRSPRPSINALAVGRGAGMAEDHASERAEVPKVLQPPGTANMKCPCGVEGSLAWVLCPPLNAAMLAEANSRRCQTTASPRGVRWRRLHCCWLCEDAPSRSSCRVSTPAMRGLRRAPWRLGQGARPQLNTACC